MTAAIAVVLSVGLVVGAALKGLEMVLRHKEKKFEHLPLAQMQTKLDELENRILGRAMGR